MTNFPGIILCVLFEAVIQLLNSLERDREKERERERGRGVVTYIYLLLTPITPSLNYYND
jgi:hypothetical protein